MGRKWSFEMATEITMPKLSDTMTEGRLISWKKSVGEKVQRGDILAEVETDKANMELEAFTSGVLLETRVKAGEMAPVGTIIAVIGNDGETVLAPNKMEAPSHSDTEKENPVEAEPHHAEAEAGVAEVEAGVAPRVEESLPEPERSGTLPSGSDIKVIEKATPMVRRLAREQGIDLKLVTGSGPDGRILQEDLEAFQKTKQVKVQVQAENEPQKPESSTPLPAGATQALTRMRAAIARTVSRAWLEIPHFTVTVAIDMGEAEEVRRELKDSGTSLSINDLIIRATVLALQKFPQVNNFFEGDRIRVNGEINIGLAVSLEEGLVVPVIKGCQGLSVQDIATRSRELVGRAKDGKISEEDISGGTFTISNLGMFGVKEFMAVIQPPQGAILAVGAILDQATVKNGGIVAARVMLVTLSADHRLIDGAYAAQFLRELKRVLEKPVSMLLQER
jgi:pyruvate dehydrogenase E2 component (dihydrolipoamide acetyltransferase)